jgi:hypothetical protein
MGEATRDRKSSTSEKKKDEQKIQGWIRIHSDESAKTPSIDEPQDNEAQPSDLKARKLEKPIE